MDGRWPTADGRAVENAGGERICWSAFASPLVHKVLITGLPTPADFGRVPQAEQLARPLRAGLSQCWTMSTAVDRVRAAIQQSGFPAQDQALFEIRQVPTPSARCTTIHMNGGGNVIFTLRGPS